MVPICAELSFPSLLLPSARYDCISPDPRELPPATRPISGVGLRNRLLGRGTMIMLLSSLGPPPHNWRVVRGVRVHMASASPDAPVGSSQDKTMRTSHHLGCCENSPGRVAFPDSPFGAPGDPPVGSSVVVNGSLPRFTATSLSSQTFALRPSYQHCSNDPRPARVHCAPSLDHSPPC